MRRKLSLLTGILCLASSEAAAGPISKYDRQKPEADFVSPGNIYDIERCLSDLEDLGGIPAVYSQPDKPDERRLVWMNSDHGVSRRVDLKRVEGGTQIKSWRVRDESPNRFDACIPSAREILGAGSR